MTRHTHVVAGIVFVTLGVLWAPTALQSQAPPAPAAPHQMGAMGASAPAEPMCPMMAGKDGMGMKGMAGMPGMTGMTGMTGKMDGMPKMGDMEALETVFAAIGVTADQKAQMSAVKDQHQADVQALTARADAAKLALREAVESLVFDESAVRAKSAALAAVMTDGAMTELRIRNEAFKVLTPDQQKKAAAIQKLQRELRELLKSGAPMNK